MEFLPSVDESTILQIYSIGTNTITVDIIMVNILHGKILVAHI